MTHTDDFDKTLTQEQIDAPSYLDWDDETLGRLTRTIWHETQDLAKTRKETDRALVSSGAALLIFNAWKTNSTVFEVATTLGNGEKWRITVEKLKG